MQVSGDERGPEQDADRWGIAEAPERQVQQGRAEHTGNEGEICHVLGSTRQLAPDHQRCGEPRVREANREKLGR